MHHVGLDVGSRKTHVCVCRPDGEVVLENAPETAWLGQYFRELAQTRGQCRIVLESCAEAVAIAGWAKDAGHEVRVVPATFAKSLGIGAHGIKTDKRDARAIAQASCRVELRSIHIRSKAARDILAATNARQSLITSRTATVNSVRGWLRTLVLQLPSGTMQTFCERVRKRLAIAGLAVPFFIEAQLSVIGRLNEEIAKVTEQLEQQAEGDEVCKLLMTHPGVGPMTALEYRAVIDDPSRFQHGDKVGSYIGVTAGENSSSMRKRRTSITKAGSSELRRLLCQAAWSYWRTQKETPTTKWVHAVADRRGKKVGMVALMRKIAVALWAMWRHNESYRALQASPSAAA